MVLGDDLDSIMCAVLMHHLLGWHVVGFYVDYSKVWYAEDLRISNLADAIWLDLDISREEIRSIGHHILRADANDRLPALRQSLNPNLLRGVTSRAGTGRAGDHGENCPCGGLTFPHKYPLGTIHFLLWLYDVDLATLSPLQLGLLWLPDSSWINGQSHKYRSNVSDWVRNWIPNRALTQGLSIIDTEDFEKVMRDQVFPLIQGLGFGRGSGQSTSRHLGLGGHQCQFRDPAKAHEIVEHLADFIGKSFGWSRITIPGELKFIQGQRNPVRYTLSEVRRKFGTLSAFLEAANVFSYVIPNGGRLNYTAGISL